MDRSLRCEGVHFVPGIGEAHGAHWEEVGDYHEGDVVPEIQSQTLLQYLNAKNFALLDPIGSLLFSV